MFKKMLLIALVLTIALTAAVAGLVPDTHHVDSSSDTVFAAHFNATTMAVLADPECPLPSSGTGGGC